MRVMPQGRCSSAAAMAAACEALQCAPRLVFSPAGRLQASNVASAGGLGACPGASSMRSRGRGREAALQSACFGTAQAG